MITRKIIKGLYIVLETNLQNPMSKGQESSNAQGKYIMGCKWFNHLKSCNKNSTKLLSVTQTAAKFSGEQKCRRLYFSILHQSKLRQHWNRFYVHTKCPQDPAQVYDSIIRVDYESKDSTRNRLSSSLKRSWLPR